MRRRRRALAVAVATVVLGAVACTDGDTATPPTAVATAAAATAATTSASTSSSPSSSTAPSPAPATTVAAVTTAIAPPTTRGEPTVALTEVDEFESPTDLAWRAGDDALYVVEKTGAVQRFLDGDQTTVLDIGDLVSSGAEQGLLGLAFDPARPLAYVDYTDRDGDTVIAEYPLGDDGNFDAAGARTVLRIDQPYPNHNGGQLAFGPDGLLYIGMGDGGSGGDPQRRAQDLGDLLGKILRIDPHRAGGQPYSVPPDNPFVATGGARPEIWAQGLRNPWKFSFDRRTGDLWIADVGQDRVEEVDVAPARDGREAGKGRNFGWSAFEGDDRYNDDVPTEGATAPFTTYDHGPGCSVSGGVRARGDHVRELAGWYVYGDYCAGRLWAVEVLGDGEALQPGRQVDLGAVSSLTAVVDGPAGELYALSLDGPVVRLDPT